MPIKKYKILKTTQKTQSTIEGTIQDIEQHFKPILHLGNHHNHLIQTNNHKTIKQLITNIEKSYQIKDQSSTLLTTLKLIS